MKIDSISKPSTNTQHNDRWLDKFLSPEGKIFIFIAWLIISIIIIQLIILLKIKESQHFLFKILSEQLAPTTISTFTAIIGFCLMWKIYIQFKKNNIFGSLPPLTPTNNKILFWMQTVLTTAIIILIAIRMAAIITMQFNGLKLPGNLTYSNIWRLFAINNVLAFISLYYLMLCLPFTDFSKKYHINKDKILTHKIFFCIYIFLGLGIFFIPIISMISGRNIWG